MGDNERTADRRLVRLAVVGATSSAAVGAGYLGLVSGALTVDLGVGRRTRPLGPLSIEVAAPRSVVYDVSPPRRTPSDAAARCRCGVG